MKQAEFKYTQQHEWVKIEGNVATIGITDHAQSELGDITYVELPQQATRIKISESLAVLESVKAASDVYSPVAGEIKEVNHALEQSPELLNSSPYDEGWICKIEVSEELSGSRFLTEEEYKVFLREGKS